jgi:hypothetical protein
MYLHLLISKITPSQNATEIRQIRETKQTCFHPFQPHPYPFSYRGRCLQSLLYSSDSLGSSRRPTQPRSPYRLAHASSSPSRCRACRIRNVDCSRLSGISSSGTNESNDTKVCQDALPRSPTTRCVEELESEVDDVWCRNRGEIGG